MEHKIPRLLFGAPKSGSGKTLITCGFLEAVKRRGYNPVSFKCGPDYIDPMFHKYVLGVPGGNLDSFFLTEDQVRSQLKHRFYKESKGIAVIEGVMGYYDGLGGILTKASTYDIARITDTSAVLIVDCKGASLSLAALTAGFLHYKKDSHIKGVILNRLPAMLYERLAPAIEETGVKVYGYLPENERFRLESRHLGLFLPEELSTLRETISLLAEQMEQTVDLDGLLKLAFHAVDLSVDFSGTVSIPGLRDAKKLRIGVAADEVFSFYYQENLELLEEKGAELIYFSPLHDAEIPEKLDGMLLGGGYPENHARALSENTSMLKSVKEAISGGLPALAECGGFLYLHKSLEGSDGAKYPMADVINAEAYKTERLGRFGYITLTGPDGTGIKGHEFHYWDSSDPGDTYTAQKPAGKRSWRCMHFKDNLLCGFPHLYYPSNPAFIEQWMACCRGYREKRT